MSKKIILDDAYYTDAPSDVDEAFGRSVVVSKDFMPSPKEIAKMIARKTITINLDISNIEFFKREAEKNGTHYQTMINEVLRTYVSQHQSGGTAD